MGRTGAWSKPTTESRRWLDIRQLHQNENFRQNAQAGGGAVDMKYQVRVAGGEWEEVRERVRLDWTPCHFGGWRPWFVCPNCGRRVAKLYNTARYYHCRHCCGLVYQSQREIPSDRLLRKVQKVREWLGGDGSTIAPFPDKPKWMHWTTYFRIRQQAERDEAHMWDDLAQWLKRRR